MNQEMMTNSFQVQMQGMSPTVPTDSEHLSIIQDNLLDALNYLTFCHVYLENTGLSRRYGALFTAVADSLNSCNEAIERSDDQRDE